MASGLTPTGIPPENTHGKNYREDKEACHRDNVHWTEPRHSNAYPQGNERPDNQCPRPVPQRKDAVSGQSGIVNHDGSPPQELQDIESRKEPSTLGTKGDFSGVHGAFTRFPANISGQEEQGATDEVPEQIGEQSVGETQRCKVGTGQDFCHRKSGTEPN